MDWQDYATGAPITAQMTAGKIDIGSMGDFPLLINAVRGRELKQPTRLVAVTGYNLRGGLNTVVTAPDSKLESLTDLRGKKVSTSVGSAADGTLVRALQRAGIDPTSGIEKLNQQPSVGASALQAGSVDALSQFVAWPGQLAYEGRAKALYDGAELNVPTFHGVTVREKFARERAGVLEDFLRAQRKATDHLRAEPVAAAESVAKETGLPHGGRVPLQRCQRHRDLRPGPAPGAGRGAEGGRAGAEGRQAGRRRGRGRLPGPGAAEAGGGRSAPEYPQATAARPELWLKGQARTQSFATPRELLKAARGADVRAAYVPDAVTGTLWFADKAVWVAEGPELRAFVTGAGATSYVDRHRGSGARIVSFAEAGALAS